MPRLIVLNVPSVDGALVGILTLRDVREGEELLMDYGEIGRCTVSPVLNRSQETALATYSRVAPRIRSNLAALLVNWLKLA